MILSYQEVIVNLIASAPAGSDPPPVQSDLKHLQDTQASVSVKVG